MAITVTFDSNVWEVLADEHKLATAEPVYKEIVELIISKTIEPYFFEGLATMEAVQKKDRKTYIGDYKGSVSMSVDGEEIYKSEGTDAPVISEYLKQTIQKALKMGFRFTRCPRIGAPGLDIPEKYRAPDKKYEMGERQKRTFACLRFIEQIGAGKGSLIRKLDPGQGGVVQRTKTDTKISGKKYASEFGEWVDGDALAANYGYGIDYFCTNDRASGAGTSSIFHANNLSKLQERFPVNVISPENLLLKLRVNGA